MKDYNDCYGLPKTDLKEIPVRVLKTKQIGFITTYSGMPLGKNTNYNVVLPFKKEYTTKYYLGSELELV